MRRGAVAVLALTLTAVAGCGEFQDLWTLRSGIVERFHSGAVHVEIEGGVRTLTVTVERESLRSLPPETQAELAYDVARFTHERYARASRVDVYEVVLEEARDSGGFFPLKWSIRFPIERAELDALEAAARHASTEHPTARR